MGFFYPAGRSGVTVNGTDLSAYSCKLQSACGFGACQVDSETFQGKNRSTLLLLDQTFGPLEITLPLEFWGSSRRDTADKWTAFCQALTGRVELDPGDGYVYACVASDLGTPAWITDQWLQADVTLRGFRQRPEVTVSAETDIGALIYCQSTFPRTDCVITLPPTILTGASMVSVRLGDNQWLLRRNFTGAHTLVLDGVYKRFLLSGENVTGEMEWEDFPYLVPGENPIGVFIDSVGVTRGVELKYRPTFL